MLRAGTAPLVVSSSVLGRGCSFPPSERIYLGIIGLGVRAGQIVEELHRIREGQIVAAADIDADHRSAFVEGLGKEIPTYNDYRRLLERKDVDGAIVATPDHWHTLQVVHSCQAGKDLYCEKPLTFTIEEGKECIDAVRSHNRVLQVGHHQRSEYEGRFRRVCEWVRGGLLGKLERIETHLGQGPGSGGTDPDTEPPPGLDWDRWLGPAPLVPYRASRSHQTFRWWYDYSGGKLTDWGTHHNDIALWATESDRTGPVSIEGNGDFPPPGGYDTAYRFRITYEFENAPPILCTSDEPHGIRFVGSQGTIWVDRQNIRVEPKDLEESRLASEAPRLYYPQEGNQSHLKDWLHCIKTRKDPICPVEVGHRVASLCHLGTIAIRLGRRIRWDPQSEIVVGDEEAQAMVRRERREGYRI